MAEAEKLLRGVAAEAEGGGDGGEVRSRQAHKSVGMSKLNEIRRPIECASKKQPRAGDVAAADSPPLGSWAGVVLRGFCCSSRVALIATAYSPMSIELDGRCQAAIALVAIAHPPSPPLRRISFGLLSALVVWSLRCRCATTDAATVMTIVVCTCCDVRREC